MAGTSKPGVVLVAGFCKPDRREYTAYIDYIDRPGATRAQNEDKYVLKALEKELSYVGYSVDYMGDKHKLGELFTERNDRLTKDEIATIKQQFLKAERNGSPMWQTILSFDNEFLAEYGLYDPETHYLDEAKMRELTRSCMRKMLDKEGLSLTSVYTAAIHYNTDNIHVHVATVEPIPTREKKLIKTVTFSPDFVSKCGLLQNVGYLQYETQRRITASKGGYSEVYKRLQAALEQRGTPLRLGRSITVHANKSITMSYLGSEADVPREIAKYADEMVLNGTIRKASITAGKAAAVNCIVEQSVEKRRINALIRDEIAANLKEDPLYNDPVMSQMFLSLIRSLPDDKRLWKYSNNAMRSYRPAIDAISQRYIESSKATEFGELKEMLETTQTVYARAYGGSNNDYAKNKISELYKTLGNRILSYGRRLNDATKKPQNVMTTKLRAGGARPHEPERARPARGTHALSAMLQQLKRALNEDFDHFQNQLRYEELEAEIERGAELQ